MSKIDVTLDDMLSKITTWQSLNQESPTYELISSLVTHDLRSPISSLKLIEFVKKVEKDHYIEQHKEYVGGEFALVEQQLDMVTQKVNELTNQTLTVLDNIFPKNKTLYNTDYFAPLTIKNNVQLFLDKIDSWMEEFPLQQKLSLQSPTATMFISEIDYVTSSIKEAVHLIFSSGEHVTKNLSKAVDNYLLNEENTNVFANLGVEVIKNMYAIETEPYYQRMIKTCFDNSIRHFEPHQKNKKIIIDGNSENESYIIKISDNGKGLTPEEIEYQLPFQEWYSSKDTPEEREQKKQNKRTNIHGQGLGALKKIVEQNGGQVKAYNNDMGGATIEFSFPCFEIERKLYQREHKQQLI